MTRLSSPQFQRALSVATKAVATGAMAAAIAIPNMTHEAPELWPKEAHDKWSQAEYLEGKPVNLPSWNKQLGQQFEGYTNAARPPVGKSKGTWPESHLVVKQNADTVEMTPQQVSKRLEFFGGTKTKADDVWIVGNRYPEGTRLGKPQPPPAPKPSSDLGIRF